MSALTPAEQLVIYCFRCWVVGLGDARRHPWSLAWNQSAKELGPAAAKQALGALNGVVRALSDHGRKQFRYHQPCCSRVGPDETAIVSLIEACQRGDGPLSQALAQWLVEPAGVSDMLLAANRLADALNDRGHTLPHRRQTPGAGRAEPFDHGHGVVTH